MKRQYQADLPRTLADEDNSIIGLWGKNDGVGCYNGVSRAWSSMNPVTLVQSWRKLLPYLEEDDLQGFRDEETRKSEILDMVCAMRSFENTNKETLKNG
jgi:hypothetical protein